MTYPLLLKSILIPSIERLAESLRLPQVIPSIQAQVFLCFRVLLLRVSPQHATSLWPVIVSELVQVFLHIEQELSTDTEEFRYKIFFSIRNVYGLKFFSLILHYFFADYYYGVLKMLFWVLWLFSCRKSVQWSLSSTTSSLWFMWYINNDCHTWKIFKWFKPILKLWVLCNHL